jgi:hypothetical protein
MQTLSATCVAIGLALERGTLAVTEHPSRYFPGESYIAISDDVGLIEVQNTRAEADARIAEVRKRARL